MSHNPAKPSKFMNRFILVAVLITVASIAAGASALGTSARSVIPSDVQQIISVDYRQVINSQTATELHDRVLPENLKQFEAALKR